MRRFVWVLFLVGIASTTVRSETDRALDPYLHVLAESGQDPMSFVVGKLDTFDLVVFDDGLHTTVEPFEFYQRLVQDESFQKKAPTIFIEVIPSNKQCHIDDYLAASDDNPQLLYPAFQDDVNGSGFPYKTYFDLLRTVRTVNRRLPQEARFRVIAVGSPTWWSEIHTTCELEQFQKSLASYDYQMFAAIRDELDEFKSDKKGIFLTNTRHAYKGIRRQDGQYFWNTTTYFTQRYTGKVYSVRLHNVSLSVLKRVVPQSGAPQTAQGLEQVEFKFVRMARGLWDSAFLTNGDRPVAFPIVGNVFGREPYVGNHQADAMPGQLMQDAYDAVIFLAPLQRLRETAVIDWIYTPEYREELKRRYRFMYTDDQLEDMIKESGAKELDDFIQKSFAGKPEGRLPQVQSVGPIDEWKMPSKEK